MEGPKCEIDRLPEACMSHVLSFTSPRDSCRAAVVSPSFFHAADSDTVWSRFLPSDYREILSRTVDSVSFSSFIELYFKLCDSVLIDGGKKVFSLKKETGAKCFTLSAKELYAPWVDDRRCWRWVSHPESRFSEVAELCKVCWLRFKCSINCSELSRNTAYKSYIIFKTTEEAYGLRIPPQEVSVKVGTQISKGRVILNPNKGEGPPPEVWFPRARSDGWMELELGEFYNEDGSEGEVSISFKRIKSPVWKGGFIVEGVQVRPK